MPGLRSRVRIGRRAMMAKTTAARRLAAFVWIGLTLWVPPVSAQENGAGDPGFAGSREAVMHLLALVPHTRTTLRPVVSYADLEAVARTAFGDTRPESSLATLTPEETLAALDRVSVGPRSYLDLLPHLVERMPETLGVGVGDVHRVLEFGRGRPSGMMLGLDPARDYATEVATALEGRYFDWHDIEGRTVWYRWPDEPPTNRDARDPSNPFGGDLGRPARIAHLEGTLVGSPRWLIAEGLITAAIDGRSMTDLPIVEAAVAAVTDPAHDGSLLQLYLLEPLDALPVPGEDALRYFLGQTDITVTEQLAGTLPLYSYVALADRSAGDRDEVLIALSYMGTRNAEMGAAVLAERLRDFEPPGLEGVWTGLLNDLDARITFDVVRPIDSSVNVALVRISHPTSATALAAGDDGDTRPGAVFRFLIKSLVRRELTPFRPAMERVVQPPFIISD